MLSAGIGANGCGDRLRAEPIAAIGEWNWEFIARATAKITFSHDASHSLFTGYSTSRV
jgi:hypothetical protein